MIRKYNNISLALGIPGLVLQVAGKLMENNAVLVVGLLLLLAGFAYYAKAKGRSPAWCLLAFLSIIGLIILACLKDHHAARRRGDTPRSSASPLVVVAVIVVAIPVLLVAAGILLPALNALRHQAGRQSSGPNDRHDADGRDQAAAPTGNSLVDPPRPGFGKRAGRDAIGPARDADVSGGANSFRPTPNTQVSAGASSSLQAEPLESRTWTDSSGAFRTEALLCAYGGGKVMLKKENGQTKVVPLDKLSAADRNYVGATMPKDGPPTDTELAGGDGGGPFRSTERSPLLGLRWTPGEWDGEKCIGSVEGIFDRQAGEESVIAREGYAVGAVNVDAGRYVHAVQIVFMRIGSDGRLDPSDRYTSDWLGFRTEKSPTTIGGTGAVVLGVQGRGTAVVDALGLVLRGR
jgi:hypothetical protein